MNRGQEAIEGGNRALGAFVRRSVAAVGNGRRRGTLIHGGQAARGSRISGCRLEDGQELGARFIDETEVGKRAAERDAGGVIIRMDRKAGTRDANGVGEIAGAPVFLGKLRECDRPRILVDAAAQLLDTRAIGHPYFTTTFWDATPFRP